MKRIIKILISANLLLSCVSTKVSMNNNYDYSILKLYAKYIIETNEGAKIRQFEFLRENKGFIVGKQEGKDIQVEKKSINKILKPSVIKTTSIVVGTIGLVVVLHAYISNKPIGS